MGDADTEDLAPRPVEARECHAGRVDLAQRCGRLPGVCELDREMASGESRAPAVAVALPCADRSPDRSQPAWIAECVARESERVQGDHLGLRVLCYPR